MIFVNRETVENYLNAVGVLVASSPTSRGWEIRQKLEKALISANEGYHPDEIRGLELIGSITPSGPDIFSDVEGKIYVGDNTWLVEVED